MKNILYILLFPFIPIFKKLKEKLKPHLCRHQMRYWDMKWVVEDEKSHVYERFNGKVWPDSFCECQKCGVKYKKIYLPKRWGEWKKSDFTSNKTGVIEVEIFEFGTATAGFAKRQKRDELLNNILK
jgi:hypothetical protein